MMGTQKIQKRLRRKMRVRAKIIGSNNRPRVSVFRSNKHIYAQVIDDRAGHTFFSVNDLELNKKLLKSDNPDLKRVIQKRSAKSANKSVQKADSEKYSKTKAAGGVGELLAKIASKKKIKKVIFDRGGYKYHGRVRALAEGARKGGLQF